MSCHHVHWWIFSIKASDIPQSCSFLAVEVLLQFPGTVLGEFHDHVLSQPCADGSKVAVTEHLGPGAYPEVLGDQQLFQTHIL